MTRFRRDLSLRIHAQDKGVFMRLYHDVVSRRDNTDSADQMYATVLS